MTSVPSAKADADIALRDAKDEHLEAVRSGDPARIALATSAFIAATERQRVLSDPRAQQ